jgi:hypothetical protein
MYILLKTNYKFIYELKLSQSSVTHTFSVEVHGLSLDSTFYFHYHIECVG